MFVFRCRWLAPVAVGLAVLFCGLATSAGESITQSEYRKRRSSLRTAAGRYITHRKRFPSTCPVCKGSGKWRTRQGRRIVLVDCKQCAGKGRWVSKKDYREVYYDLRTPAFRAIPGIKEELGKQYDLARQGRPWPTTIKRYRLHEWELIDATHGISWFKLNASRAATPVRWIYASSEGGGKPRWYLWSARSDGAWPTGRRSPLGVPTPQPDAMPPDHGRVLRAALARSRVTFRLTDSGMAGKTLLITLEPGPDPTKRIPEARVGIDAVRLGRALLDGAQPWTRVQAVWRDHFRDEWGRIALRPRWISALDKAKHDGAAWDTLGLDAQVALVALSEVSHVGWEPVEAIEKKPAPAATEPGPATPTPTPTPAPDGPTPGTSEPAAPKPATPPPGPTPPATAPVDEELPALTKKAEREAAKGLEEIRRLLQAATDAFNAGQQAHREGAHDLWQEKLAEASTHLSAIQAVWYEDIVPAMPGSDEMVQDAVANEHFGDIWSDVDKLSSMVRKLAAMK